MKNVWLYVVAGLVGLVVLIGIASKVGTWLEGGSDKGKTEVLGGPYSFLIIDAQGGKKFEKHSPGFPGRAFPNKDELVPKEGAAEPTLVTRKALGTIGNIRVWGPDTDVNKEAASRAFDHIEDVGGELNVYSQNSEVMQVNRAAGVEAVQVSDAMMTVMKRALLVAELSDGAFDPTVGPLVDLWSVTMQTGHLPAPAQIEATREVVGYKFVELDEAARTVKLTKAGMKLNLSAIAKGYLADEGARVINAEGGVQGATVELGGDIAAFGHKPDGSVFHILIENPFVENGPAQGIIEGTDFGVVTSGNYRQFVVINSQRYSHIIDPKTGQAIPGVTSCTVTGPDAMTCDALATAICVMGYDRGLALVQKMNQWYKQHPPER